MGVEEQEMAKKQKQSTRWQMWQAAIDHKKTLSCFTDRHGKLTKAGRAYIRKLEQMRDGKA